jgi:glucokinase
VIGVDVGGTTIRSGVVDAAGRILRSGACDTPERSQEAVLAALEGAIRAFLSDPIAAVGLGVPSHLERGTGRLLQATNVALADLDLEAFVRERFGLPVGVENDANAAALAEWKLGAGRGLSTLVVLTLGTGVGGGLVLDGHLYRGWAELGHVVVQVDGPPCQGACTGRGHLEALVSGTAADRAARELWGADADARLLVERAQQGDGAAQARMAQMGHILGAAVGSFANLFDPDLVVVGGGFGIAAGDLLLEPARAALRREALAPARERLDIVPAELGPDAGLVGAALVGREALERAA